MGVWTARDIKISEDEKENTKKTNKKMNTDRKRNKCVERK
jgi:hypothetical protein